MLFLVLCTNVVYQGTHTVYIISQNYTTYCLNKDHHQSFLVAGGSDVSEADSEHDGGAPIVGPNVLLVPGTCHEALDDQPVGVFVDVGHAQQHDRKDVGVEEVEEEDFDEGPVLFFVVVFDEVQLELLYALQPIR